MVTLRKYMIEIYFEIHTEIVLYKFQSIFLHNIAPI